MNRRRFLMMAGSSALFTALSMQESDLSASELPDGVRDSDLSRLHDIGRGATTTQWTENWESGMVTGNGSLGAVVYGRPGAPTILVNHNRLYTSQYDPASIGPARTAEYVPEIRRLIREEGYEKALDFSFKMSQLNGLSPGESIDYHPGLFLDLSINNAQNGTNYLSSENFQTGEVLTSWTTPAGGFVMRAFASRADDIIVCRIDGPGAGELSFNAAMSGYTNSLVSTAPTSGSDWIGFRNSYSPGNGGYDAVVRACAVGGTVKAVDQAIVVQNADYALLFIKIVRYRPPSQNDYRKMTDGLARTAPNYDRLAARHIKIHSEIFNRVKLDLGGGADRIKTTDELLSDAKKTGSLSAALVEKIYDACRYVILSSSGDLPPNLQGIWNGSWSPPWHSDYSADANLQLAVESQCSANMPELMLGLFNLIESGVPSWREGARKLAGCRGILYPARMQDRGVYFQQNHDWQWFNQVSIAGWLGHYFYDYYRYTGDLTFLKSRAIPYLKECALFYEDWYVTDADGRLRSTPSFSYECASADNATIDFAVARETLTNLIAACVLLNVENDGVPRWKALLSKIPEYMVNSIENVGQPTPNYWGMDGNGTPATADGCLKEFVQPNMVEYPSHRHMSSLYPLFVSNELFPDTSARLWTAATKQYLKKISSVHESESHYRMQASLCAARLGRGDDAWGFLTTMALNNVFHTSLVPSHYDNLSVFNVDASGGIPAVINNLLIFSLPGRLDLLPALPAALKSGRISGILARGQIRIDSLAWDMVSRIVEAELTSAVEQRVVIGLPPFAIKPTLTINGQSALVETGEAGRLASTVTLHKGKSSLKAVFSAPPVNP